jgi:hypothetical protein
MRDSDRTKLLELVEQGKNDTEISEVIDAAGGKYK